MTDVAEQLGLSHALLYRYVESKEALLELAASYAIDQGADLTRWCHWPPRRRGRSSS